MSLAVSFFKGARRRLKHSAVLFAALVTLFWLFGIVRPAISYYTFPEPHPALQSLTQLLPNKPSNKLSVNLVVASTSHEDIAWTSDVPIPNLNVIRYRSDAPFSEYHPPIARGREALMYFTYLHDFYDTLPDVSIFVHADETPWHVEGTLLQNTSFALSQLNLNGVLEREYFNLRVTWRAACPAWINTTKTLDDWDKLEEPYFQEAWRANFDADEPMPEILAGPCCSQFAVSRAAIRRRPLEQYRRAMDWLMQTSLDDKLSGRVWERMWPWLFKKQARDCAPERQSLCDMYGLCFSTDAEVANYKELWEERERLKEDMSFFRALIRPAKAAEARLKMSQVRQDIEQQLSQVWLRAHPHG